MTFASHEARVSPPFSSVAPGLPLPTDQLLMELSVPPPLVLLACSDEWMSRSFESVFEQHGYAVARVKSGARTIKLARRANPDVVVLEAGIVDLDALRVCSALGDD